MSLCFDGPCCTFLAVGPDGSTVPHVFPCHCTYNHHEGSRITPHSVDRGDSVPPSVLSVLRAPSDLVNRFVTFPASPTLEMSWSPTETCRTSGSHLPYGKLIPTRPERPRRSIRKSLGVPYRCPSRWIDHGTASLTCVLFSTCDREFSVVSDPCLVPIQVGLSK